MYVCMARYDMVLVSKARARQGKARWLLSVQKKLFSVQTSVRGLSLVLFFFYLRRLELLIRLFFSLFLFFFLLFLLWLKLRCTLL